MASEGGEKEVKGTLEVPGVGVLTLYSDRSWSCDFPGYDAGQRERAALNLEAVCLGVDSGPADGYWWANHLERARQVYGGVPNFEIPDSAGKGVRE